MKINLRFLLFYLFLTVSFIGCNKHKPSKGAYLCSFNGAYEYGGNTSYRNRIHFIEITDITKDAVEIVSGTNKYSLVRNKGNVSGTFTTVNTPGTGLGYRDDPIVFIDGDVTKEKGVYFISGTFISHYYVKINETTFSKEEVSGDFTMEEQ